MEKDSTDIWLITIVAIVAVVGVVVLYIGMGGTSDAPSVGPATGQAYYWGGYTTPTLKAQVVAPTNYKYYEGIQQPTRKRLAPARIVGPSDSVGIVGPSDSVGIVGPSDSVGIVGPSDSVGIVGPSD